MLVAFVELDRWACFSCGTNAAVAPSVRKVCDQASVALLDERFGDW